MSEIRTVTTLRSKAAEIRSTILAYEKRIKQARADLSHVTAAIAIFEASGDPKDMARYVDLHRLFKRGEAVTLCKAALTKEGELDTRQLAARVMEAKGLDTGDKELAKSVCLRIVQALRMQAKRNKIGSAGKRAGVRVWKLASASEPRN
jgi:hypothetical protein